MSKKKKKLDEKIEEEALEILPEEISEILDEVPERQRSKIKSAIALSFQKTTVYRGPLPHPDILEKYNEVVNNGAERITKKFEEQSDHRRETESKVIEAQIKQSQRGQIFGFIIAIIGLIMAFTSALMGHDTFASIIGGTTLVGLVSIFVAGKYIQKKELREKE